jgi:hypothetical protein
MISKSVIKTDAIIASTFLLFAFHRPVHGKIRDSIACWQYYAKAHPEYCSGIKNFFVSFF